MSSDPHLEGYVVSKSTYINHGCTCDGCRKAWREYQAEQRRRNPHSHREQRRRLVLAARWVKRNQPRVWLEICDQAEADVKEMLRAK